jgi:hypothetical protein
MVLSDSGLVVFLASGALLPVGADPASTVSVAVKVAVGAAVVPLSAPPPTRPPTPNATTAVMITVGQPNLFGFFGGC